MADWSLRPLWLAGRFLTRLPFPEPSGVTPQDLGRAVCWYPFIGFLLGVLIALGAWLLGRWDAALAATSVLILWVWASGALHLDGLADTADAWMGGIGSRERTLAILKDPRSGPAAITTLGLLLIAKWSGLQILIAHDAFWLLAMVPLIARTGLPLLMLTTPYVRPQGIASDWMAHLPRRAVWAATLAGALVVVLISRTPGVLLCALGAVLVWSLRRAMLRRLGGFTGDTAGAQVELTEAVSLLGLAFWILAFDS